LLDTVAHSIPINYILEKIHLLE